MAENYNGMAVGIFELDSFAAPAHNPYDSYKAETYYADDTDYLFHQISSLWIIFVVPPY